MCPASTLEVTGPVTIDGNGSSGASPTVIDGQDSIRPFLVQSGSSTTTFKDLRVEDGFAADPGGAIRTDATTTLDNVVVTSSGVTGNTGVLKGGGIFSSSAGATLTVQQSAITDNAIWHQDVEWVASGGGIVQRRTADHVPLDSERQLLQISTALTMFGAGIQADQNFAVSNSTISGNTMLGSPGFGGGISAGAAGTLTNVTLAEQRSLQLRGRPPVRRRGRDGS